MNKEALSPERKIADERQYAIREAVSRLAPYDVNAQAEEQERKQNEIFATYAKSVQSDPGIQGPIGGMVVESEANSLAEAEQAVQRALEEFGNAN